MNLHVEDRVQIPDEEIKILEVSEQKKIGDNSQYQHAPVGMSTQIISGHEIEQHGADNQSGIYRIPPGVEKQ